MITGLFIVFVVDAILCAIAKVVRAYPWPNADAEVPLSFAIFLALSALFIHGFCMSKLLPPPGSAGGIMVLVFVLSGLIPTVMYMRMVINAFSCSTVNRLYGWEYEVNRPTSDFSRAHTKRDLNDLHGAVEEYKRYFLEDQRSPHALLEAAHLLEREGYGTSAAEFYMEVLDRFNAEDDIWTEAAYSLANLYENCFHERNTATHLLGLVIHRRPNSPVARLAGARLFQLDNAQAI